MARTVLPSWAVRVLMRRYIVSGMSNVVLMAYSISHHTLTLQYGFIDLCMIQSVRSCRAVYEKFTGGGDFKAETQRRMILFSSSAIIHSLSVLDLVRWTQYVSVDASSFSNSLFVIIASSSQNYTIFTPSPHPVTLTYCEFAFCRIGHFAASQILRASHRPSSSLQQQPSSRQSPLLRVGSQRYS